MMAFQHHLHLVSDATGETIHGISRACLAQFEDVGVQEHFWSLVRTKRQLDVVLEGIGQWPGLVLYTLVDEGLRDALTRFCREKGLPSVSVLDPVMSAMIRFFGKQAAHTPGRQHVLDANYFARIEAVNYAMATDDGNRLESVNDADVIVLGVSRTSKTPTCVYLANRGLLAANIPIVPGVPLPVDLENLKKPMFVGLTKDPDSLVEIRRSRLRFLQNDDASPYIDPEKVHKEVQEARRLFARLGCPVIDVTRRSVEETASEIMMLLNRRTLEREKKGDPA
ncbi:MAG: kinase/pyrophosphorylase [Alphaproteobacteria bacterium]|nr:kinase/pyrophosphorylase [Alphaproteobacteria bacterium]